MPIADEFHLSDCADRVEYSPFCGSQVRVCVYAPLSQPAFRWACLGLQAARIFCFLTFRHPFSNRKPGYRAFLRTDTHRETPDEEGGSRKSDSFQPQHTLAPAASAAPSGHPPDPAEAKERHNEMKLAPLRQRITRRLLVPWLHRWSFQ